MLSSFWSRGRLAPHHDNGGFLGTRSAARSSVVIQGRVPCKIACFTSLLRRHISCSRASIAARTLHEPETSRRQEETPFNCVNNMALPQHPRLLLACAVLLAAAQRVDARSSPISDLKSKISGVEELLEEFRKQLQQDQAFKAGDVVDSCVGDFNAVGERIIRAKASIEQGATFLLAPDRVYTWKDCLHACCSQPHCTVAVVQEDPRQPGDSLSCYLFNCTYRNKHVCSFAPQQGFTTYSQTPNTTQGHPAAPSGPARRPGEGRLDEDAAQGGRSHKSQAYKIYTDLDIKSIDPSD